MIRDNDIPKYMKKKNNTSKSKEKSKHKHIYEWCLLKYPSTDADKYRYSRARCCTICGKIGDVKMFETNEDRRMLSNEETLEKYKHLPTFEVNNVFDKYVPIVK